MPCLNPLHIYNRSTFVNRNSGSLFMDVPCGKCEECVKFHRVEWLLRAYYEWQDCVSRGGFGLFDTLTYNPESLEERTKFGIPCFSKTDIRLFFKKFRKRMSESGYSFRYLITCEYGEKRHRPHYHLLFFIIPPDTMSAKYHALRVNDMVKESWTEPEKNEDGTIKVKVDSNGLVKYQMRSLGFNDPPSLCVDHVLKSAFGLRYVTKYITKDDEYYSQLLGMKKVLINRITTDEVIKEICDWFDMAKPFHLQSLGFGACALKDLELMRNEIINDPRVKVLAIDAKDPIPLPLYYLRKLFYDCTKTQFVSPNTGKQLYQWRLTKLGKLFKSVQIEKRVNRYVDKYANLAANACAYSVDGADLTRQIRSLLGQRTWKQYSIYRLIYKGHYNNGSLFVEDSSDWLNFYLSSLEDGDEENYNYHDDIYLRYKYRRCENQKVINDTYNPDWEHFDEITNLLNEIEKKKNLYLEIESIKVKEIRKNLSILKPD